MNNFRKGFLGTFILLLLLIISACSNNDQNVNNESENNSSTDLSFPEENIEIIAPFGAGDSMDLAAHALSKEFEKITGQLLVVNNQPGGSGVPGTMKLVNSKPDGYTIGIIPSGQLTVRPHAQEVDYSLEDFTPIIGVGDFQMHPVASADAPYDNVAEMVEFFESNDETLKAGTPGVNTYSHIFLEMLSKETGLTYNHLPFDGGPEVAAQILGGNIDIGVINESNVASEVEAGNLKILGFPTEERFENFPDVPTIKEQGINIVGGPTFGIYGPADMPEEIAEKLEEILNEAVNSDSFISFAEKSNIALTGIGSEEMMEQIYQEYDNIKEILK